MQREIVVHSRLIIVAVKRPRSAVDAFPLKSPRRKTRVGYDHSTVKNVRRRPFVLAPPCANRAARALEGAVKHIAVRVGPQVQRHSCCNALVVL